MLCLLLALLDVGVGLADGDDLTNGWIVFEGTKVEAYEGVLTGRWTSDFSPEADVDGIDDLLFREGFKLCMGKVSNRASRYGNDRFGWCGSGRLGLGRLCRDGGTTLWFTCFSHNGPGDRVGRGGGFGSWCVGRFAGGERRLGLGAVREEFDGVSQGGVPPVGGKTRGCPDKLADL